MDVLTATPPGRSKIFYGGIKHFNVIIVTGVYYIPAVPVLRFFSRRYLIYNSLWGTLEKTFYIRTNIHKGFVYMSTKDILCIKNDFCPFVLIRTVLLLSSCSSSHSPSSSNCSGSATLVLHLPTRVDIPHTSNRISIVSNHLFYGLPLPVFSSTIISITAVTTTLFRFHSPRFSPYSLSSCVRYMDVTPTIHLLHIRFFISRHSTHLRI